MKIANHPLLAGMLCLVLPLTNVGAAPSAPQAVAATKQSASAKTAEAEGAHEQAALYFAGLGTKASDADGKSLQKQAEEAWTAYDKHVGQPLLKWAKREIAYSGGGTVFYPFSGPDFPTVARMYPDADRYVLVAIQKALQPTYPAAMDEAQRHEFVQRLGAEWSKFGRLGYFITEDLDHDQHDKTQKVGVTAILMAFAARLGYEVVDVVPLGFNAKKGEWQPLPVSEPEWKSVRLSLRKDGRNVTLDYIRQDLSDGGMQGKTMRAWMEAMAGNPTLLKAASHLLQDSHFAIMRDIVVKATPMVVQDETGLDYGDLKKIGAVHLYGNFRKVNHAFMKTAQPALATAYKAEKSPGALPFAFSYLKAAKMRSIQIARRQPAQQVEANNDAQKQLPPR